MSKSDLRQTMLRARRAIPQEHVRALSLSIKRRLESQPEFIRAHAIAAYAAKPDEVQTSSLIDDALAGGKRVVLPVVDPAAGDLRFFEVRSRAELSPGRFGVLEPAAQGVPVPLSETDAVVVPLVAWDEEGERIGYGKGYFDRALASRARSVAIGLGFESQMLARIPADESDVPLDMVVTEKRVVRFGSGPR